MKPLKISKSVIPAVVFIFLIALPLTSVADNTCRVLLSDSALPLEVQLSLGQGLPQFLVGSGAVSARVMEKFDPIEFTRILHDSGVTEESLEAFGPTFVELYQKSIASPNAYGPRSMSLLSFKMLYGVFNKKSTPDVGICVIGGNCSGFKVGESPRSFLNTSNIGPVVLESLEGLNEHSMVDAEANNYFNLVHINANVSPPEMLVDLFSGLGSAQMRSLLYSWTYKVFTSDRQSDLFAKVGLVTQNGTVVIDKGFEVFISTMGAHLAEIEVHDEFKDRFSENVFNRPESLFNVEKAIKQIEENPLGRKFLEKNNLTADNALDAFKSYRKQMIDLLIN